MMVTLVVTNVTLHSLENTLMGKSRNKGSNLA